MTANEQSIDRVMRWRLDGSWIRVGQYAIVAPLAWLATNSILAPIWFGVTLAVSTCETIYLRLNRHRMHEASIRRGTLMVMALSTSVFSSICPILMAQRSAVAMAGAALLLCATTLNNAVKSRGWAGATWTSLTASTLMLVVGLPLATAMFGMSNGWAGFIVLEAGSSGFLLFIALLIHTLNIEALAVQRARARWRMLFQQSPLPQLCFDASQIYLERQGAGALALDAASIFRRVILTEANEASLSLFDRQSDRVAVSHDQFHANFVEGFVACLAAKSEDGSYPSFDARIIRRDGQGVDVRVQVRTVPGDTHPLATCIASFVDMTEVKRMAEAQDAAVAAAQAANQAKSDFLAIMSHEIRTPLNGVLGMVQAMKRDALSAPQRERLDVIGHSGSALLAILNNVLDLSKIEAGMLNIERVEFDLGEVVSQACGAFEGAAIYKGLKFEQSLTDDVPGLYLGDPVRLRQVLLNLISNAVKFTSQGFVRVDVLRENQDVVIAVTDSGIGLSPDKIDQLFERFVQADTSTTRQFGGTGLGLAICRELCTAMGGDIAAHAPEDGGSRFVVRLPLEKRDASPSQQQMRQTPATTNVPAALRVLAAEDNELNRLVLRTLLPEAEFELTFAENGQVAVDLWDQGVFDVILMDVHMPVMDGLDATREIRRRELLERRPPTPIIALTADAMQHQVEAYRAAGMGGFVSKPINISRLFKAMTDAVNDRPTAVGAAIRA